MTSLLIVAAFVVGMMLGAVVGVAALSVARVATDPKTVRAENEQYRRES
jgi:hypothetical protein